MEEKAVINNTVYDQLGERWYTAQDDPIALLRAESKVKTPWIIKKLENTFGPTRDLKILDIGCGGGFLTNDLAMSGYDVTGIDLAEDALAIAKKYDVTGRVNYQVANALNLPWGSAKFDAVTAMDFLEHIEDPLSVIKEVSRVLKPGGLFFFHTFNRNLLSHFVIIKLVEWMVKNTPKDMHVSHLFIKPREIMKFCEQCDFNKTELTGIRPKFSSITWRGLRTRSIPNDFQFILTKSLALAYLGCSQKNKGAQQ